MLSCLYVPRGAVSSQSIRTLLAFRVKGYRLVTPWSKTAEHKRSTHTLFVASDGTSREPRPVFGSLGSSGSNRADVLYRPSRSRYR